MFFCVIIERGGGGRVVAELARVCVRVRAIYIGKTEPKENNTLGAKKKYRSKCCEIEFYSYFCVSLKIANDVLQEITITIYKRLWCG